MRSPTVLVFGLLAALSWTSPSRADAAPQSAKARLLAHKDRVAQATVTLPERSCAGAVAGDREHVVTAAHCIPQDAEHVRVRFSRGVLKLSTVEHLDRDADLALLRLSEPAPVEPLEISDELPRRFAPVLFVGRTDRASRVQVARIDRLGRCPSLPGQPQALFTSVQAVPGDSGAPLVDSERRLVGVIHGGAACHIAAPTHALAPMIGARPSLPSPPADDLGWSFERTPEGFRFRWNFRWSFGS